MNTLDIAREIVHILEEKKGESILLLDIQDLSSFADFFVICSGTSDRMLDSLAEEVLMQAKQKHGWLGKLEGKAGDGWLVADLGDIIVHLFSPDQRDFYRLEQLWEEGKVLLRVQ